jgi:flagellin-like protein
MFQPDPRHVEESREITAAVRRLQEDPSILELARTNLVGALDRLELSSGTARRAVAPVLTAALAVAITISPTLPRCYWS